jgi:hypothetical protein
MKCTMAPCKASKKFHDRVLTSGFELSKNKGGLTSAYSLSLHTGDSASLTTAGFETDPPGYPRASCLGGVSKQLGVQPPNPPAIQTLLDIGTATKLFALVQASFCAYYFILGKNRMRIIRSSACTFVHEVLNQLYVACWLAQNVCFPVCGI